MDELRRQVRRAQWRLGWSRFLDVLGGCLAAALALALVVIAIDKFRPLGWPEWMWGATALGLGVLAAVVWSLLSNARAIDAAMEIDRRFELKERLSSTLALDSRQQASEAGQALLDDTLRRVRRIDVASRFAARPSRRLLLPLAPGLAALLLALLVAPPEGDTTAQATTNAATQQQIQKSTEVLQRRLLEQREQAKKEKLEDAEKLLKKLEERAQEITHQADRQQALVKLKELTQQVQDRRAQLGNAEQVKQQLGQLKNAPKGPAEKFAQAVGRGNIQQALEELKNLKQQLGGGKLSEEQREQLARQLDQMEQKLREQLAAQQNAQRNLKRDIERMRQSGQGAEADKLQQQLDKLLAQAPAMQQLDDMALKLGQCAQCLRQGDAQQAQQALGDLQAGLDDLKKQLDEANLLDAAMDQLDLARDQMTCDQCGGKGCPHCQGGLAGQMGAGQGDPLAPPGPGLGKGKGEGPRPEAKTGTSLYDSHVRQQVGQGTATIVGQAGGPNVKGNVEQQIQSESQAVRSGSVDPLTDQRMPREHRDHTRDYFDHLRKGN